LPDAGAISRVSSAPPPAADAAQSANPHPQGIAKVRHIIVLIRKIDPSTITSGAPLCAGLALSSEHHLREHRQSMRQRAELQRRFV